MSRHAARPFLSSNSSYRLRLLLAKLVFNLRDLASERPPPSGPTAAEVSAMAEPAAQQAPPPLAQPPPLPLFAAHSKAWLLPLLELVFESLVRNKCLNYLASDLLHMVCAPLLDAHGSPVLKESQVVRLWDPTAALPSDDPKVDALLSHILESLFLYAAQEEDKSALREHVRLVRLVLEAWRARPRLQLRRLTLLKALKYKVPAPKQVAHGVYTQRTPEEARMLEKRELRLELTQQQPPSNPPI